MKVSFRDLGQMDYKACWDLQQTLFDSLTARKRPAADTVRNATGTEASAADAARETDGRRSRRRMPARSFWWSIRRSTLGKSGRAENLLIPKAALEAMGAKFFHIDRGGDITFHGPGQLVCYPILDLERLGIGLREYIASLEEAVIRTTARYGIAAGRIAGASGVWIGEGPRRTERDARARYAQ